MPFLSSLDRLRRSSSVVSFGFFRKDLAGLLASAESADTLAAKIQWLEDLVDWIRLRAAPEGQARAKGAALQSVRVRFFLQTLERNPAWRAATTKLLGSLLSETDSVSLLAETGLHNEDGFFGAALERTLRRVLPAPRNERNLAELFSRIFSAETDADWLRDLDPATLQALLALLFPDEATRRAIHVRFARAMADALVILSANVESLGLSSEIRQRSEVSAVSQSAFYRLSRAVNEALDASPAPAPRPLAPLFLACREEIASAFRHLEERGVSVAIVYRLEKLERSLARMESLVGIVFAGEGEARTTAWLALLADLVSSRLGNESLSALVEHNLHMLSRKIVERTGASGEHYITSTPREYFQMLGSAAGGGVLTAGTALIKTFILSAGPALFFEGLFAWINYSASFLLMQGFHFTLATKQPSMTAPALAAKLQEGQGLGAFTELVARLTRSQTAAAIGNIGATVPTAILLHFLVLKITGHSLFSAEYARHNIDSLHPWKTTTVAFGALTGVVLWLSSVGGGWLENFFVYRRLGEAIRQSPWLARTLGPRRAEKVGDWLDANIAGIGGNICLGFLLAFTPVVGRFFGVPLATPHVTLTSASLAFSFCALPTFTWTDLGLAVVTVIGIGALNFGVSFVAALLTAFKAREVRRDRLARLGKALAFQFRREPLRFFFPPRR